MNTMKSVSRVLIIAALMLVTGYAQAEAAKLGKGVAFRFNPPDGTTFVETYKHTTKKSLFGIASKPIIITTKTRITIKKTDKGYHATKIPIYYNMEGIPSIFGNPARDAIIKFLDCTVVEYELDKEGKCIGVVGIEKMADEIEAEVRKIAPRGMRLNPQIIMSMIESAASIEAARWDARFSAMAGHYMNVGESVKASTPRELPYSGELIKENCVTKLSELVKVGGKEFARVQRSSTLDNETLCDWYNKSKTVIFSSDGGYNYESAEVSSAQDIEKIEYTIDPSTQLPHSISSKSTTKIVGSVSDTSNIQFLSDEWEQYTYDYSK